MPQLMSTKRLPKLFRIYGNSTENFRKFFRESVFHKFEWKIRFLAIFEFSENFSERFRKFSKYFIKSSQSIVFGVLSFFTEGFYVLTNQKNCMKLVAGLRVGIYECLRMGIYKDHLSINQILIQPVRPTCLSNGI